MEIPAMQGVMVLAGNDRFGRQRRVFGGLPMAIKVASGDTNGGCLVIEQSNDRPGGPPRHLHHRQEEWFYVVAGDYLIEIGGRLHQLAAGDALLAPRGVPHAWARTGTVPGRLLIVFQPAGDMEAFFEEATKLPGLRPQQELASLFEAHGMQLTGPPLEVPDPDGDRAN